jgi:hypothetical protein
MKLIIKAAIVLAVAVALCPFICKAKDTWAKAQPRIQQEKARAEGVINTAKDGVKAVDQALNGTPENKPQ